MLVVIVFSTACGTKAYQNVNARYNGYFYANEYVKEVYQEIEDTYQYNFNDLLKIYPDIDSSTIQGSQDKLDDAFKKSSQVIEWYPGSDWVDDNYLVIGQIRYLRAEFQFAVETFQYVYNKSKDNPTRQKALILLMRTYMDMGEIELTREVMDYIDQEDLTVENAINYKLQEAFLHQRLGETDLMKEDLAAVVEYIPERDQRGRANFILGQLAEREGDFQNAFAYYNQAIKGNPPYELLFHTQLRKMAVTDIRSEDAVEKAYKFYDKLLRDGKNTEYQDKIYYSMGRLEQRRQEYQKAITHYLMALEADQPNPRTQGLASLRIAQIYYDEFENYRYSSTYYDSTVIKLPKDEPGYESIEARQKVLNELVTELNIIDKNDSLLALSELSEVQLDAFLDQYLDRKEAAEKAKRKKDNNNQSSFAGANRTIDSSADQQQGDGTWYFYNIVAAGQGQQQFQKDWGNRPNEDNWRRSQKTTIGTTAAQVTNSSDEEVTLEVEEKTSSGSRSAEKASLIESVPRSADQKKVLNDEIASALFESGRIYRFGLEREDLSEQSYLTLLERYPNSDLRLETLYALYTLNEGDDITSANGYKETIIEDYPDSLIAKLLINPNYLVEKEQRNQELQRVYEQIYITYESGNYQEADQMIRQALASFEDVDFLPNVELLAAIIKGRTEGLFSYENALNEFSEKYPEGELYNYAQTLLSKVNPAKDDIIRSDDFEFSEDFVQLHLVAVSFNISLNDPDELKTFIDNFNKENFKQPLSVGYLSFDDEAKTGMVFVNSFKTKSASITYNLALTKALNEMERQSDPIFHNFAISRDNFTMLFQSKKLDNYLKFNKIFYQ